MQDFVATSVAHGLKLGEFEHLSLADKKKLVRLMARIAERSYRRGFQHGTLPQFPGMSMQVNSATAALWTNRPILKRKAPLSRRRATAAIPPSRGCSWNAGC